MFALSHWEPVKTKISLAKANPPEALNKALLPGVRTDGEVRVLDEI